VMARISYAILAAKFSEQDRARQHTLLVDALQSRSRPEHRAVFERFKEFGPIAIVGSSLRDISTANDIDLLFPANTDFRKLAKELGARYLGKFASPLTKGDVRRLSNIMVEGVSKPVQCISDSSVTTAADWPHAALTPEGRLLNGDKHYQKLPLDTAEEDVA
jgi:hypothetical protein